MNISSLVRLHQAAINYTFVFPLLLLLCLVLSSCGGGEYTGEPYNPKPETSLADTTTQPETGLDNDEVGQVSGDNTETSSTNTETTLVRLQAAHDTYKQMCSSCHGANGVDGRYGGLVDLGEDLESLTQIIHLTMPTGNVSACIDQCAQDIAELILLNFDLSSVSNSGSENDSSSDESASGDSSGSDAGDTSSVSSDPPLAVNVSIVLVNSVEADLTWQNNDASVTEYRVERYTAEGAWETLSTQMGGISTAGYRVLNLTENELATFRIVAVNSNGETSSEPVEISTESFEGAELYEYQCAACHGDSGNNGIEPNADLTRDISQSDLASTVERMIAEYASCRFENCATRLVNFIRDHFQQGPQANLQTDASGNIEILSTVNFSGQTSTDNSGIAGYQWDFGDGNQATGANVSHQFTVADTYTVSLTVTDAAGWQDSNSLQVTVVDSNLPPVAEMSVTTTSGAAPLVVSFNGSGSSDPNNDTLTYQWSFGDDAQAMGENAVHTYSQQGQYTARLTVTDTRGLTHTAETTITVNAAESDDHPPLAVIDASATMGQAPVTINFSGANSTDPDNDIDSYQWMVSEASSNSTTFGTNVSSSYEFTAGGTYTISLVVTDKTQLVNQHSITVEIQDANAAPTAELNWQAHDSLYAPLIVSIDASGSSDDGSITAYDIRVDGESVANTSTTQVTLGAGEHTLEVVVTDDSGVEGITSANLTVLSATENERNLLALDILNNSCLSCHDDDWGDPTTETQLVEFANDLNSDVIIPGDASSSKMMTQIWSGNMPRGNAEISEQETVYLEYWINNLSSLAGEGSQFICNEDASPSVTPLRRLTKFQYVNTLHDLLEEALGASSANDVMSQLASSLDTVPKENQAEGMNILDQRVDRAHVQGYFNVAIRLASVITENSSLLVDFVGDSCATNPSDMQCLNSFFERWAPIVLRRPLTDEDRTFYENRVTDYYSLISMLLMSPQFLYLQEFSGAPVAGGVDLVQLDAWELASRLSYLFYQSMPDAALRNEAANGTLLSNYEAAVDRILADPKARDRSDQFYKEWLKLEDISQINESGLVNGFDDFLTVDYGNGTALLANMDLVSYREAAIREILALTDYYTWQTEGMLSSLFTSNLSFADSSDLATAYGVSPWQAGNYDQMVALPSGERAGLLTRAALHIYGNDSSRPIMKGVQIRREFLCDTLHPPQDNNAPAQAIIIPEESTRDQTTALTEIPGTACASCHADQINYLGFPTESFDSLGRHRTFELVLDDDGMELSRPAINTVSTPKVEPTDNTMVADAVEFSELMADHPKTTACFARQYFRYTYLRMEDLNQDGCVLQGLEQTLQSSTLLDMMRQMALRPEFKLRQSTSP